MHKLTTKLLHYLVITLLIIQNLIYPWISILPAPPPVHAQESPPFVASYSAQTPAPSPLDLLLDLNTLFSSSPSAQSLPPEAKPETPEPEIPEAKPESPSLPTIKELRKNYRFDDKIELKLNDHTKQDSVTLTDPTGFAQHLQPDGSILTIDHPNGFRPGKYTLTIQLENGQTEEQSFSWGVLAINTNRSVYTPGQPAYLQMAALSDTGRTLCHANLSLEIIEPGGTSSTPTVLNSDTCGINNVTDQPDYFAYYLPTTVGTYQLKLTNLDNGYDLTDHFEVKENVPFDVERISATRINPFMSTYQMKIRLKAHEDFTGTIKDSIPEGFELIDSTASWQVSLKNGEQQTLSYTYQAPKISPEFYFLGGLTIGDYQDSRPWQLASDADSAGWLVRQDCGFADGGDNHR